MADYKSLLVEQLRAAQVAEMRRRYLDLIEEAQQKKETQERDYFEDANAAYLKKRKDQSSAPQQLKALGLGGGVQDEAMTAVVAEYEDTMASLRRKLADNMEQFRYAVEKQSRLMEGAMAEFNARVALEDYQSTSKSRSSSKPSGSSSGASAPPQESTPAADSGGSNNDVRRKGPAALTHITNQKATNTLGR